MHCNDHDQVSKELSVLCVNVCILLVLEKECTSTVPVLQCIIGKFMQSAHTLPLEVCAVLQFCCCQCIS